MNKTKLANELKQKIKLGVKPSDLRKNKTSEERSFLSNSDTLSSPHSFKNNQLLTPPPTPPLKPSKEDISPSPIVQLENNTPISPPDSPVLKPTKPSKPANNLQELQQQVIYWSNTAQSHLLNLSKTSADLFNAEERIKELENVTKWDKSPLKNQGQSKAKDQPETVNEATEKALIEANQRIRELQEKNTLLMKNIASQEKPAKSTGEIQQEAKPPTQIKLYLFTCNICEQNKKSQLHLARVNGLGIDPNKQNKICDACFKKVDIIKEREEFF
jgi:hypothetical protein